MTESHLVLLFGFYGAGNLGDELMAIVMSRRLPRPLMVVRLDTEYCNMQFPTDVEATTPAELERRIGARRVGRIVVGGGAIFTFDKLADTMLKMKTAHPDASLEFVGVSIDPAKPSPSERFMSLLRRADILECRDGESAEWFRVRGCPNVSCGEDLLSHMPWGRPVGVALAEQWMNNYSRDAVRALAVMCRDVGRELMFVPMMFHSVDVEALVKDLGVDGLFWSVMHVPDCPTATVHVLRGLSALLSFKYHSAMIAMEAGVPTLSAYTENANKFRAVHDGRYGCADRGCVKLQDLTPTVVEEALGAFICE